MELYAQPLVEADVNPDPFAQFDAWFAEARAAGVREPEAVAVATATSDGAPSVRMVLMKAHDSSGFVFFTNYASRKGNELEANPRAAMMFHWDPLGRAVRIEGAVARTTREESAAYFASRPRGSQFSALASEQSAALDARATLEQRVSDLEREYDGRQPPEHPGWGGYRLSPVAFEFWQNRNDRLHDRLLYTPAAGGGWTIQRLQP